MARQLFSQKENFFLLFLQKRIFIEREKTRQFQVIIVQLVIIAIYFPQIFLILQSLRDIELSIGACLKSLCIIRININIIAHGGSIRRIIQYRSQHVLHILGQPMAQKSRTAIIHDIKNLIRTIFLNNVQLGTQ